MSLPTAIESLNLPKQLLDKTAAFLTRLLGPAVDESAELIADKIKFRRFRNQVRMLHRAEEILNEAGLRGNEIGLRTLVPLVEKASLEEDASIQEMWSKLLANAAAAAPKAGLHAICIQVLSSISPHEAKIMSFIHRDYIERRPELLARRREWRQDATEISAGYFRYKPHGLVKVTALDGALGDLVIDNLIRLGVLRFEVPEIEDGQNTFPDYVELTDLGLAVLKEVIQSPKSGD